MKNIVKIVLLVFMLVLLFLFIREVNMNDIIRSLRQIGWIGLLFLLLVTGIAYWMASLGWKVCIVHTIPPISTWHLFLIRHVGEIIALINPTSIAGGEAMKMMLITQQYNIPRQAAASSILISRVILIYTQLLCFFCLLGVLLIQGIRFPLLIQQMLIGLFIFLVITLVVLFRFIHQELTKIASLPLSDMSWWKRHSIKLRQVILSSIQFFRDNPRAIASSSVYAILHWLFGGLEFCIILRLLQYDISITTALFIDLGVVFFKTAGAFIPGQVGVEELGNKMMLAAVGITDQEVWVTASLLRRGRQLCWIVIGMLFYMMIRHKIIQHQTLAHGNTIRKS